MRGDNEAQEALADAASRDVILALRDSKLRELSRLHPDEDISSMIAGEKYGFIAGALAETLQKKEQERADTTHIIDALVTNRLFGFPIFPVDYVCDFLDNVFLWGVTPRNGLKGEWGGWHQR